ncbi:glycosyltransferase [Cetobacterium sp. SF1]|uniref:glycosyltransferase n=1 Tax=Cetobacterium sp. SF1 TaxID=3417654 RepID=UPI003CF96ED4
MKKTIVIRSGSLRMGGLERVLIEVLQNIDREKFNLYLIIEDDCGKENIFEKDIPEDLPYYFLKSKKLRDFTERVKRRKKNIIFKILYNIMMRVEEVTVYRNIKKLLNKIGKIDVLVDYDTGASKYIEKISGEKKVAWIHNSIPKLKGKKSKIERYGKRLNRYDMVVAICDEMKDEIEKIYPFLRGRVKRIYNPFNFTRIINLGENREELEKEDMELLRDKYYVAVSRLDTKQKDYDTLLKGFKIAREEGIEEKLYIIGDGVSKMEISKKIKSLNLEDSVKLLGMKKNPYIWMKNSQGFIHSSKFEGFGLVLVEAEILGKMVISSGCPVGPREILGNGEYGVIFEVGNSQKLGEILIDISRKKISREYYEHKSLERAESFNSEKILREYEKLIEELC